MTGISTPRWSPDSVKTAARRVRSALAAKLGRDASHDSCLGGAGRLGSADPLVGGDVTTTPLVHVVDDDAGVREALAMLLASVGIETRTYPDADAFLSRFRDSNNRPALVLLDVRMPGISGMALLEQLRDDYPALAVIMMTAHGDIEMAVRAMKLGAADFIAKPFGAQDLLDRIQAVFRHSPGAAPQKVASEITSERLEALTPREREVFDRIVRGESNKVIALELGISVRTVESHRARIMTKTGAKTLVDLVLLSVDPKHPHP